ncbi:MAG TPA: APC family permease [Candidatus Baltobacteraceae bacterium]|jgi:amino acid transporter|nr:APC family permease [Candidatus Baltobacteraceae bacterium]
MHAPPAPKEEAGLIRAIGVPGLTANIVNSTVGAGIFALPALVAAQLGAASPVAYIICALAMCLFVTSFAMAGSRVSLTGGLYAYVETAFGRYVGFLAGVLYFLTAILAISGIVGLIASSVGNLIPSLATQLGRFVIILSTLLFLAAINIRGVKIGARAVETVTVIKLAPLIIFVIAGIFFLRPEALAWPGWPQTDALGRSVLLLLFAFVGVEVALVPSGEIKQPARTVPRAIFTALGITTLLYIMIQLVALGVLGSELGEYGDTGLAEAAARFLGNAGRTLMLAGLAISAFGWTTSDILSSPRIIFAFGRDGFLPKWFAHVHPRFHTPDVAIITYAATAFALSFSSTFQKLAVLSNMAVLLLYILCCLAALELNRRDTRSDPATAGFKFPGQSIVPIVAIVFIIWVLAHATKEEFVITAACLAAATLLFFIRKFAGAR